MPKVDHQKSGAQNPVQPDHIISLTSTDIARYWLSAIIESAQDAIIGKTLEGIITSWNTGAERLFGYTAIEIIGKPVLKLIPPELQHEEPLILSRIRKGERIEHYETVRVRKDGRLIDISLTVSPIKDDNGTIIGISKIARDITERKQSEARLKEALSAAVEAKEEAENANRLKDEFLATVSHELRTPLNSILGWSQMLVDNRLDEDLMRKAVETIYRNVKSQAQLVEDLLDISRIVNGKMRLKVEPLDPKKVIAAAVESAQPAAEAKNIRLQLILDANCGIINGDFERLQQVVWNLLSNAVKFTPEGGLIQVCCELDREAVKITVRDNGIGIKPKFLPYVFERFSQADGTTTRKFGGMGLGLSIVKSITELHGGKAIAESKGLNEGAAFTVILPVFQAGGGKIFDRKSRTEKETSTDGAHKCPPELKGLKILVVDDQIEICELSKVTLEECGCDVITALSAGEALALLEKQKPDVILADLSMPEMDGFELIRRIRKRNSKNGGQIPAVAITALARIEDRMRALAAGYQMFVIKPIEITELREIVASLTAMITKK